MDAHILLSPVGQKTETRFNCFLTENRKSTEMVGTPSTVRKLLPPPTGRSPSLKEGGLGAARALSKILIQLRVQGRNPGRFNGGYGVPRGFKGEKSKSPPNPLGLAERVHRPVGGGRSKRRRWKAFVPIAFMPNFLLFSDAHQAYEAQEAYEAYEE